ncbi:hypothetical protein UFOVP1393_18 [uncultured Caudovirales phage]|uniref:Uncharacterized protein n=1 Tax=uncultured Caudovirales phage TaxID=2100421 RepID=A0A6J5S6D2_9CAUD|nr:hypothetical protein UFOVP1393_18 [uncultured Caudovirales phage]
MKESYKEFKNECLSNKLQMIQSIETQLIQGKLGSESILFTDFIYNTREMLGIEPPKNAEYEALKVNRTQEKLNEVLAHISNGYLIKEAIRMAGQYDTDFYNLLNDDQAKQLQFAKREFNKNKNN